MPGSLPSYQSLGEGPRQSCFESSSSKSVRVESHWAGVLLFSFFLLGQGFLCTMKPQLLVTESSLWNSVNKHFMVGSRQKKTKTKKTLPHAFSPHHPRIERVAGACHPLTCCNPCRQGPRNPSAAASDASRSPCPPCTGW